MCVGGELLSDCFDAEEMVGDERSGDAVDRDWFLSINKRDVGMLQDEVFFAAALSIALAQYLHYKCT